MHLGAAIGSPKLITFRGKEYMCHPITLGDIGTIQRHLADLRPNIIKDAVEACKDQPPAVAQQVIAQATKTQAELRNVTMEDAVVWMNSGIEGYAYAMYLILHHADPKTEYTPSFLMEYLAGILHTAEFAELDHNMRDLMAGDRDGTNPTGPRKGRAAKKN